jgi:acyl-CoA thioesterase FadM
VLAKARTVWCPIDAVTGRLASVSAEVRAAFSVVPQDSNIITRPKA